MDDFAGYLFFVYKPQSQRRIRSRIHRRLVSALYKAGSEALLPEPLKLGRGNAEDIIPARRPSQSGSKLRSFIVADLRDNSY